MAATNKSLVQMNKSIGRVFINGADRSAACRKKVIDTCAVKLMLVAAAAGDRG
jgi:hypothetical protein